MGSPTRKIRRIASCSRFITLVSIGTSLANPRAYPTPAPTPPRAPRIPRALRSIVAVRGSSPQRRTVRSLTSAKDSHRAGADLR